MQKRPTVIAQERYVDRIGVGHTNLEIVHTCGHREYVDVHRASPMSIKERLAKYPDYKQTKKLYIDHIRSKFDQAECIYCRKGLVFPSPDYVSGD